MVITALLVWCVGCSSTLTGEFPGDWSAGLGVWVDISSKSSSESTSLHRLWCIFLKCYLFLLNVFPAGICTVYNRGSSPWCLTTAGAHPRLVCICTVDPGASSGSALALWLYWCHIQDWKSTSLLCMCCGVDCWSTALVHGIVLLRTLPINILAGD